MEWGLEWNKEREAFLWTLVEQGQVPNALLNKPRLRPWVLGWWKAFWTLTGSRQIGMGGIGPIPFSEIAAYLNLHGVIDDDDRDAYITTIQALDSAYLNWTHKAAKAKTPPTPPQRAPGYKGYGGRKRR